VLALILGKAVPTGAILFVYRMKLLPRYKHNLFHFCDSLKLNVSEIVQSMNKLQLK